MEEQYHECTKSRNREIIIRELGDMATVFKNAEAILLWRCSDMAKSSPENEREWSEFRMANPRVGDIQAMTGIYSPFRVLEEMSILST